MTSHVDVSSDVSVSYWRKYGEEYWNCDPEWLPRRAELDLLVSHPSVTDAMVRLEIDLESGAERLYRYFPFSAYIYVNDVLAAIVEFGTAAEKQTAVVDAPVGRKFSLTIISELGRRFQHRAQEPRDLGVILRGLHPGATTRGRPRGHALAPIDDHFSQRRIGLLEEAPAPIFVIGPYRSGTSVLSWAIGQHPNIWPLEETGWLQMFGVGAVGGYRMSSLAARSFFDIYDVSMEEYLAQMGSAIDHFMRKISERYLYEIMLHRVSPAARSGETNFSERFQLARSAFGRKRRWVDGTPENVGSVALLRKLFPAAKFLATIRNPRAVIASMMYFNRAGAGGASTAIQEAGSMWQRMVTSALLAARAFGPESVKFVDYDEITSNPGEILEEVFDFLEEPRFPRAADSYGERINSSKVDEIERAQIQSEIDDYIATTNIDNIYEEARGMLRTVWTVDADAKAQLEAVQRHFVAAAVRAVFSNVEIV